ncbi:ASCH/PUA domain-containing protein [Paenibacillus peoriae]|uniref:ASCH/PUA domain-containing protein n=1 Tax=Paenibacillus peoriae TaxID=59893 RepID=UPI00096BFB85|nr:ASCH/PUA domain-containing protein [Paenibacillus peoriae]OMF50852.1 hypothetical protein BK135_00895 [Paenibacillus peoriae]
MTHDLKILPKYFDAVCDGRKPFEVRKNDRNYQVGDLLDLKEWTPDIGYTGGSLIRRVSYFLDDPDYVKEGFVILGLCHPEA